MNRRIIVLLTLAIATVAAVAWSMSQRDRSDAVPSAVPPASQPVAEATQAPKPSATIRELDGPASVSQSLALPNSSVSLLDAVPMLKEFAEAGNAEAGMELSRRLSYCTPYALRRADEADHRDLEQMESDKKDDRLDEARRSARAKNQQRRIEQNAQQRQDCSTLPADLRAHWLDWVDRVAQTGNADAMLEYARMAIVEYDSVTAVVADIDVALERRDKVRSYLTRAVELGVPSAFREMAYAYDRKSSLPSVFSSDPYWVVAYAHAGISAGASREGDLDWLAADNAKLLDAKQLADAERQGRALYERCCAAR